MAAVPQAPGLRVMKSFYTRANEVEGSSTDGAIVAYYCRAYAFSMVVADMGKLGPVDKQELMACMDYLEKNKVEVRELGIATPAQGAAVVAKFARNVFDHADTEDRLGSPNGSTVQSLIAASVFMDSLKFFAKDLGDKGTALLQEFGMKAKFAKFRAAEIARAMKAGAPVPPRQDAMGAEPSLDEMFVGLPSVPSASASQAFATAPVPAPYTAPAPAPYTASAPAPYTAPAPAPYTAPAPVPYTAPVSAGGEISGKDQAEAQKHAKYAVSALQYKDVTTAISELRLALASLGAH